MEQQIMQLNVELEHKVKIRTQALEESMIQQKQIHNKLLHAERMSASAHLVSGIAHEVNTPLGVCLTGISQIQDQVCEVSQKLNDNQLDKKSLKHCLNSSHQLTQIMSSSLTRLAQVVELFRQVSASNHVETKQSFNLNAHCKLVMESYQERLIKHQVTMNNCIAKEIKICSYLGVFTQMLNTFIDNSLTHANIEGGIISIDVKLDANNLSLIYGDSGQGIPQERMERIFEPFYTTKLGQGTSGLGLSVVHNLVTHKLRGDICCSENGNSGLKITVIIPKHELGLVIASGEE